VLNKVLNKWYNSDEFLQSTLKKLKARKVPAPSDGIDSPMLVKCVAACNWKKMVVVSSERILWLHNLGRSTSKKSYSVLCFLLGVNTEALLSKVSAAEVEV